MAQFLCRISFLKLAIIFLLFNSCNKYDYNQESYVIGHGGMGVTSTYPMNSLESFLKAMHHKADGVEIDVQMTKDGELIAFHDEFLEHRSTGKGKIEDQSWETIQNLRYTNYPYLSYKIRKLDEVLSQLSKWQPIIILDIKSIYDYDEHKYLLFKNNLSELIIEYQPYIQFIVESKDALWLSQMKEDFPELLTLLYGYDFYIAQDEAVEFELDGIALDFKEYKSIDLEDLESSPLLLSAFNVHLKSDNRRALERSIDYIQTEQIDYLLKIQGRK